VMRGGTVARGMRKRGETVQIGIQDSTRLGGCCDTQSKMFPYGLGEREKGWNSLERLRELLVLSKRGNSIIGEY